MRRSVFAAWAILLASFAILAVFYNSLPAEVVVARSVFGGNEILAPKLLFTVFRVPIIEVVCGLAIVTMLYRTVEPEAQKRYDAVWLILLHTTAFKSLFQTLETISPPSLAGVFFYITLSVVAAGAVSAIFFGAAAYAKMDRSDWKLSRRQKLALVGLLFLYLGFAIVPIFVLFS